jgi:hypothetical protein
MLGSNPGLLRIRHWQSDALTTRLNLIQFFLAFYWSTGLGRFRQKLDLESYWLEGFANWTPTPKNYKNSASFSLYAASSKPISFNNWAIIKWSTKISLLLQFQSVFAFFYRNKYL